MIATIRGRLVLMTLGMLIPGFLIGAYLLWDSYNNSRAAFERQLSETARALSLVVDRELGQAAALNRALSTSPYVTEGDFTAFDRQARQIERDEDTWVILTDESGRQLVNTSAPAGAPLPASLGENPNLWRQLQQGDTVVSNLTEIPGEAEPVIMVHSPVLVGPDIRYALSFAMRPKVFGRTLAEQDLPSGWNGNIFDRDQNLVARSTGGASLIGRKPSGPVNDAIKQTEAGVVESVSFDGLPTIVAHSRSPAYRWTFAVSVPRDQLTSAITRNLFLAAVGGLGILVFGTILSAFVARSISRPVEGLVETARLLGQGKEADPPDTSIREVRAVAEGLRGAADDLAARTVDLRSSESRLRLAVQATGLGIWDVDVLTGQRTWSPEFYTILGLPPESDASMDAFLRCIHPEDRSWVTRRYTDFLRGVTAGFYEAEFRICRADNNQERWVNVSGRLLLDGEQNPLRASGTMFDLTERRRSEDSLRESEERFRSMADSAPALIWMTDSDGRLIFANRYHESFFGLNAEQILKGGWASLIEPEDLADFTAELETAFDRRQPFRRGVRVRDGAGSTRWLLCEGAPRKNGPVTDFLGYVGCNVDITQSKLAADALERRIDERTSELAAANRQLLAQIEERERVEETLRQVQRLEAVGQLTSGVAHDFNNLLTVVLGNLTFIERTATEAPVRKRLANMRMAAERGASLVAQLLAFSRRQRLEPKIVNLSETVGNMRELLQSSMGGSVAVEIHMEEDLWPALVDLTQIELIILNLAINARDAMDVGGLLKVSTANVSLKDQPLRPEEPAPGDYVVVSVADSGSGMNEEVRARVFEPFFTTKEVGKGSGLGLSQVLGFAKQSGGGVRLETSEGRGTVVNVFVPRASGVLEREQSGMVPVPAPEPKTIPRILLVDDDDLVRDVTGQRLEELGYDVKQAGNGPSALLELEQDPEIDLLILDFAMPGMNGAEVARAARKRRPDIPLFFLTGYADLTALGEFASEPILHKPFRDAELSEQVVSVLQTAKSGEVLNPVS